MLFVAISSALPVGPGKVYLRAADPAGFSGCSALGPAGAAAEIAQTSVFSSEKY